MLRAAGDWVGDSDELFEILPNELEVERDSSAYNTIMGIIREHYFSDEAVDGFIPLFTDVFFAFPAFRAALEHAQVGTQPIYFYKFTADTNLNVFKARDAAVSHKEGKYNRCCLYFYVYTEINVGVTRCIA